MKDLAAVEDTVKAIIFLYDIGIVHGSMIGELARRSFGKHSITVWLLRYNSHHCCVSNINAFFKTFHCSSCDEFIDRAPKLERSSTTCKERVKHFSPQKVYQLQETLFEEVDSFSIHYSDDQKLSENMAIFNFESICVQKEKIRDSDTTT